MAAVSTRAVGGYSRATITESIMAQIEPLGPATATAEPGSPEYGRAWSHLARQQGRLRPEFREPIRLKVRQMQRRIERANREQ